MSDRLHIHRRFASQHLSSRRDIAVYLPPGYRESRERYPVFFLQDGQNLFDPATAFNGQDWHAGETADAMLSRGEIRPVILVGIYNTGVHRISEYTPTRDRRLRKGGKADRYARMLAREIKPFIDREYRTLRGPHNAAVGGSSLGALASLTAALLYPRVFGASAVMSPSVWWDGRSILQLVRPVVPRPKVWLDVGTAEGNSAQQVVDDARALHDALAAADWQPGVDLDYHEFEGATHSERAWAARFGAVLRFLFGGNPTVSPPFRAPAFRTEPRP